MSAHFSRPTLLIAAAAAILAGCGGGGHHGSSSSSVKITSQPTSTSVAVGSTATFSVSATGSNLSYQWYRNATPITDATSATYTTPATVSDDNGATFYVVVTSASGGDAKSDTVTLTVGAQGSPTITTQPSSLSAPVGGSATFSVAATGDGLSYQWYKGSTAINGATDASYTLSPVVATSAGSYHVVVTNANGSVTSSTVTLTIGAASKPTISSQPSSQDVVLGARITLTVGVSGSGNLTYQWYKDGNAISGATGSTLPLTVDANTGGSYTVTVTNDLGSATSSAATLTVVSKAVITTQPTSQTVYTGQSVTFTVAASGSNLTYQWYQNGAKISGATSPTYTTNAGAAGTYQYTVVVTNKAGSVSSSVATLTVNGVATITTQPSSTTVGVASPATFTVAATGAGSLTYQWRKNGTNIDGATGTSYTTPATTTNDNGAKFTVVVTNPAGSVTSTEATLTVDQAPVITSQPASVTVTNPATATFSVTATASGVLTYQWYSTTGGLIQGATSSTYTTPATTTSMSGTQYYVKVYNDGVIAATSSNATLTVN